MFKYDVYVCDNQPVFDQKQSAFRKLMTSLTGFYCFNYSSIYVF
jgi:hypothetical protein